MNPLAIIQLIAAAAVAIKDLADLQNQIQAGGGVLTLAEEHVVQLKATIDQLNAAITQHFPHA